MAYKTHEECLRKTLWREQMIMQQPAVSDKAARRAARKLKKRANKG